MNFLFRFCFKFIFTVCYEFLNVKQLQQTVNMADWLSDRQLRSSNWNLNYNHSLSNYGLLTKNILIWIILSIIEVYKAHILWMKLQ